MIEIDFGSIDEIMSLVMHHLSPKIANYFICLAKLYYVIDNLLEWLRKNTFGKSFFELIQRYFLFFDWLL